MRKRMAMAIMAAALAVPGFSGCGDTAASGSSGNGAVQEAGAEEQGGGKELLVVSFGTSYNDSRNITIGAIEGALREAFPDYDLRRAFTSQIIIDKLKERDGIEIPNVEEALADAAERGVSELVVQPTHLMDGFEFNDLKDAVEEKAGDFAHVAVADPLLSSDADYDALVDAITERTASYDDGRTAICFMGHGTEADSNKDYAKLQEALSERGFAHYFIGTVEAEPSVDDVIAAVQEDKGLEKAVLLPLMVVAGDHANNDMAGDDEDSWKSRFEAAGYEVECIIEGLGQDFSIGQIYVGHTAAAIEGME